MGGSAGLALASLGGRAGARRRPDDGVGCFGGGWPQISIRVVSHGTEREALQGAKMLRPVTAPTPLQYTFTLARWG